MKIIDPSVKVLSNLDGNEALRMIQRCAKTCYKSYKDTDDNESAKRIVQALIKSGHHSMLENYIVTFNYVSNIAAYKDLTRSRVGFSYSVESTRYCLYAKDKFHNEIKFLRPAEIPEGTPERAVWERAMWLIEKSYLEMARLGATPDQLSLLLPQSTAAEFNITGNLRAWRNMFELRALEKTGHVRPCVQEIMVPTLEILHREIPVVFDDQWEYLKSKER